MKKAVLFDLDGVLTEDATGTTTIVKYFQEMTEIDASLFEKVYRKYNYDFLYGNLIHEDVWDDICQAYGRPIAIESLHQSFLYTPIDRKMIEIAKQLKVAGYLLAIVTDNKVDRVNMLANKHKWHDLFDAIVISATIGSGKKEKAIFDETLKSLNIDFEACVMIDNNRKNLEIPNRYGMNGIYFDHDDRDHDQLVKTLRTYGIMVN